MRDLLFSSTNMAAMTSRENHLLVSNGLIKQIGHSQRYQSIFGYCFKHSDWLTQSRLSAHKPYDLIWQLTVPGRFVKLKQFRVRLNFINQLFHSRLLNTIFVKANAALRALLAVSHFMSNERS